MTGEADTNTLNWRPHIFGYSWDILPFYEALALELPDPCAVVEVGSLYGRSVLFLAETLHGLGKRANVTAVDTWAWDQHPKATQDAFLDLARSIPGCDDMWAMRGSSTEMALGFPDASLDLVFIDADHSFDAVKADIEAWRHRVKPGGLIAGHDYHRDQDVHVGVSRAVNEVFGVGRVKVEASVWSVRL